MSRVVRFLALLAVIVAGSACAVTEYRGSLEPCQDMTVGETETLSALDAPVTQIEDHRWTFGGPGVFTEDRWDVHYEATEPGTATFRYEGWELDELLDLWNINIGGNRYILSCVIEVSAADSDSTTEPPSDSYTVVATVTESTVEEIAPIGFQTEATWRLLFDCDDGRCDAEIVDGGPFGRLAPFTAAYDADGERYVVDFTVDTPDDPNCGDDRWIGGITPTAWDSNGPAEFTWSLINHVICDTSDQVFEWEGTGTRR